MKKEIIVPIEPHFAGNYRIEYDGKYTTLFGRDRRYKGLKFNDDDDDWFEEMVLIPVVFEARNADPEIREVTQSEIFISYSA